MRKKFLVKPRLQLKHLMWTMGVVLICLTAGYFLFDYIVTVAVQKGAVGQAEWTSLREMLRMGFLVILVIGLGGLGIENFLFFHSVVGPLYVLERGLRQMAKGDLNDIKIRESDELGELIDAFQQMKVQIQKKMEIQDKTVRILAQELDRILENVSGEDVKSLRKKLKEIRAQVEKKAA